MGWENIVMPIGGNMLHKFLHPEEAYKKAQIEADRGYNKAQEYQKPILQQGQDQYSRLNTATGQLLDPATLENQWAQSYETSPYAKQLLEQNQSAGLDAASSMGLSGSSAALGNIQQGAGNIIQKDRQQFMQDLMQKYLAGIGLGENIYGHGASAASAMGGRAMEHGNEAAGLQFGRTNAQGELFGKLAGMGIDAGLNYATGGGYGLAKGLGQNSMNSFNQGVPEYMQKSIYS